MIPFMGLQAFDFCASALFTFAVFSYLPYLTKWLQSLVSLIHQLHAGTVWNAMVEKHRHCDKITSRQFSCKIMTTAKTVNFATHC